MQGSYGRTIWHSGYAGALIFLGYFLLAAVGIFVLTQGELHQVFQPNVLFSLVIAGFIYPIVFGGLGAGVMHEVHKRGVTQESSVAS